MVYFIYDIIMWDVAVLSKLIDADVIVDKYYTDVYKFCCARCKDAEVAQDITQDTFLVFTSSQERLVDDNIRAWLLTVANNKLREYFRKKSIEKNFVSLENVEPFFFEDLSEKYIESYEMFDEVQQKILNILNDREKELFIKLYIENKSVSLIKEELNITEENFRARKSRMKKKVKKSLGHIYFFALVISFKIFH